MRLINAIIGGVKNMKTCADYVATFIYILTFTVPPLLVGTFFGRTAERLAFCIVVGYLAWRWANIFLQLEHANELAKKYLEEEGNKNETD